MQSGSELLTYMMGQEVVPAMVRTSCPKCGQMQTLDQGTMSYDDPMRPTHICRNGCGPILIVGLAMDTTPPDRGTSAGAYSLRNPTDLFVTVMDESEVLFPARRHALD